MRRPLRWWLAPVVWCILLTTCQALLRTSTDHTRSTSQDRSFPCYDYEGDESAFYNYTGPLIPIPIHAGCTLEPPKDPWVAPTDGREIDGSFVFFLREDMEMNQCVTYGQALEDFPALTSKMAKLGYPPVRVALLAANSNSNQNFGSSDEEYFFDYASVKPPHVSLALIGRDSARELFDRSYVQSTANNRTSSVTDGESPTTAPLKLQPTIIQLVQDEGMWNRDRKSAWYKFRTAMAWSSLTPLLVIGIYLTVQTIRWTGQWLNVPVFIFSGALIFLAGGLIAPISTTQNRIQVHCRYIAWMAGYICYCWILLSWASIIKKTQSPRFLKAVWAGTYLGLLTMFFYALLNMILTVYPTDLGMALKKWFSLIFLPAAMLIQGMLLFFYGMRFLVFIKGSVLFANIRLALKKLTVLCLATFVGFIIFAICGTLNQSILHAEPWIMTLRAVLYNTTVFLLVAMIFWVVRIHDSTPFGYRRKPAGGKVDPNNPASSSANDRAGVGGGNTAVEVGDYSSPGFAPDGKMMTEPNYDRFSELVQSTNTLPLPTITNFPSPTHSSTSISTETGTSTGGSNGHGSTSSRDNLWPSMSTLQNEMASMPSPTFLSRTHLFTHPNSTEVSLTPSNAPSAYTLP
ncbi:hypothetical protein H4R33_005516 [Dimargaris cristalligena]|uniref:Lung seven transmembrane receptor-domain-containing protein n=1 Tax=Dimargaris cristalligena TaxID=215637 RepID=A0A4Q0A1N9_9FUNG|nr:hypothetical protein H4R33_005516 [Dimargaris cristalligena]RKP39070.1 hypothetical protein BJ085DRAFT_38992 [Dimargaris cristalligena]|eukprot:RKP39070.1 hypothetical protein BJ085DRAFT_38992 [Dimargaris cristalligena]